MLRCRCIIEYTDNSCKKHQEVYDSDNERKDNDNDSLTDSESFIYKSRLASNTNNVSIVNAEIALPLK